MPRLLRIRQLAPAALILILSACSWSTGPETPTSSPNPSAQPPAFATPTTVLRETSIIDETPVISLAHVSSIEIPAPSLANNMVGEPAVRPITVYVPPSYQETSKRYPVLYYLPGFGDTKMLGVRLPQDLDTLIEQARISELIVVIASGRSVLGGSFYVNSPVTGNWEDFIVSDLVEYMDSHYRTIAQASARGISGHSMGGFGALNIALHHPDIFSAVYGLSPGLFDQEGLAESQMFARPDDIRSFLGFLARLSTMPEDQARQAMRGAIDQFSLAYGAAFAPNPDKAPPYLDYPYTEQAGQLVRDATVWARWESGFGGTDQKITRYQAGGLALSEIALDCGRGDEYAWIPKGCIYFADQLEQAGMPHTLAMHNGTHESHLGLRIIEQMLPFFSHTLTAA